MIAIEVKINHLEPMLTQKEKRDIQDRINKKMSDLQERMDEYKELTKPIPPSEAIGRVWMFSKKLRFSEFLTFFY